MAKNLAAKILEAHLVEGELVPGREIAISIDHTLLQDATGTMAMLEFMAMGVDRVKVELAAQYIDHNLLQTDNRNADDHMFLISAGEHFGIHVSKPETAFPTRCTWNGSGHRGAPCSGPTPIHRRRRVWRCWPSAPAGWMLRWPWRDTPSIYPARGSGGEANRTA